jgi:DNA-binding NarL/FixJ family response regulator
VFLIDDHPVVRQGMGRLIDDQADLMMCGQAESPPEAMRLLADNAKGSLLISAPSRSLEGVPLSSPIWIFSVASYCIMSRITA